MKFRKATMLTMLSAVAAVPAMCAANKHAPVESPVVLVIGASLANGSTPFNDQGEAPLGGIAVGSGDYLSLGNALAAERALDGRIINEAQAGGTTFERPYCPAPAMPGSDQCSNLTMLSYEDQLQRAAMRTAVVDPATGAIADFRATHVVITMGNDCLHSDSRGIPQAVAPRCTPSELEDVTSRMVDVGSKALEMGITPVYTGMPKYNDVNFKLTQQLFGFAWMIDEASYNAMRESLRIRVKNELPDAIMVEAWNRYEPTVDGLHPNDKTTRRASSVITKAIVKSMRRN